MRYFLLSSLLLFMPPSANAAIVVHEVAWMGDVVSANHEWIELYNSGSAAVSLDGWVLTDGSNLSIALSGVVDGGHYAVLERTSDEAAPGVAFLIYTGALVNTGATLQLLDANGSVVDQVAGGENWSGIGGDNTTKDTAQYTTSGWITAPATPGAANAVAGSVSVANPTPSVGSGTVAKPESRPPTQLSRTPKGAPSLSVTLPEYAYVGQSLTLSATIVGVGEQLAPSTEYHWNFGDTYAKAGRLVTHTYAYPGTYVLTVTASVAGRTAYSEETITVLPVTVSLTRTNAHDIQLHNDAMYAVDLSGYVLRGAKSITLPPGTMIAPRGTITIAHDRLEAVRGQSLIMLYTPAGEAVAYVSGPKLAATAEIRSGSPTAAALPTAQLVAPMPTVVATAVATTSSMVSTTSEVVGEVATTINPAGTIDGQPRATNRSFVGLLFLLAGALLALWTIPRRSVGTQNTSL